MRIAPIALASLLLLAVSCKKNSDEPVTDDRPALTAADLTATFSSNNTVYFFHLDSTAANNAGITAPASSGTNWNYAGLSTANRDTIVLASPVNSAFTNAAYARVVPRQYGIGPVTQTVNVTEYYEISNSGWLWIGHSLPAFTLGIPGTGSLSYAAQNDLFAPQRLPLTPPMPLHLNDSISFNTVLQENSLANASVGPFPITNAPAAQKTTYTGNVKAYALGTVSLPGRPGLNTLIVRRNVTTVDNFLLNGAPPPPGLIPGLQDGVTDTNTYYDFYNYGGIGFLGTITVHSGHVVGASFRAN